MARIFYADLFGPRDDKYNSLLENDLSTTHWTELSPQSPFYLFVPQNIDLLGEYEQGWKVTEIMSVNVLGYQTHRDHFAMDFNEEQLWSRINEMREVKTTDEVYALKYGLHDNRDWQLAKARRSIQADENWETNIIRCLYRPFDWRPGYFNEVAMDYPRRELRDHVAGRENLCLLSSRQQATLGYKHCWVAKEPANDCVISTTSREANQVFPLYLYPNTDPRKQTLFDTDQPSDAPGGRRPNLNPAFIADLEQRLGMSFVPDGKGDLLSTFGPEDIFNYMYALFHSPTYRTRYAEFLKIDFPRLPLTSDPALFRTLCALGEQLVGLHLMENRPPTTVSFPVRGNNKVEKVQYTTPTGTEPGRVHINKTQHFDNVPPEAWEFHIGGYQVAEKWLKDRKGRTLTLADMQHYQGIIAALLQTANLMLKIDAAIPSWPLQ